MSSCYDIFCDISKKGTLHLYLKNISTFVFPVLQKKKKKKNEISIFFFRLKSFVDKTTFDFYSFNKISDFVTTQYGTAVLYPFYLNP